MKKRSHISLTAILLSLALLAVLPASGGSVTVSGDDGRISWQISEGVLRITVEDPSFRLGDGSGQPWYAWRSAVREAVVENASAADTAYFFTGMKNLVKVTLPAGISAIGPETFRGCSSLSEIVLGGGDPPEVIKGAFSLSKPAAGERWCDRRYLKISVENDTVALALCSYDWEADSQPVTIISRGTAPSPARSLRSKGAGDSGTRAGGFATCTKCEVTCRYDVAYEFWNVDEHCIRHWCTHCGEDQLGGTEAEPHTFSGDVCTRCGYGRYCTHPSTTITRDGCYWYERCDVCRQVLSSGADHDYILGQPYYLSRVWHRTDARCLVCGKEDHIDGEHSCDTVTEQYDETSHVTKDICEICGGTVGDPVYEAHSFTWSRWQDWSADQHRRAGTCFCGETAFRYEDHYDHNGDGACDECGHVSSVFSVTVPSSAALAMSETGDVTAETGLSVMNRSTCAVTVSGISIASAGGWTVVPYSTDMAREKVDSKLIGLSINGAASADTGDQELPLAGSGWTVAASSSLPLDIRAKVSAVSAPVSEQVLTLCFVIRTAG